MDSAKLIVIVQEYEELYNLKHADYCNQQRRDTIWEEIGAKMNETSKACRLQWTRIRDNHRKAMNLRKTKSGQSASKIKPPKYYNELQFLLPFYNEDGSRISNVVSPLSQQTEEGDDMSEKSLSSDQLDSQTPNVSSPSTVSKPAPTSSFSHGPRKLGKKNTSTPPQTAASVLDKYLKNKEMKAASTNRSDDPLTAFFINMAETVKTFPLQDQILIKGQVFQLVHSVELRLAQQMQSTSTSSATALSAAVINEDAVEIHSLNPMYSPANYELLDLTQNVSEVNGDENTLVNSLLKFPL